jgi:acyl-CoA thioester hydrolase
MGVVYYANYLVWCEIGRTEHIATSGIRYSQLEQQGIRLAVSEAELRYHAAARYDDLITIETTLETVKSRTMTFAYVIRNEHSGVKLVTARTTLVSIDASGRPVAMPLEIRELLQRAMA